MPSRQWTSSARTPGRTCGSTRIPSSWNSETDTGASASLFDHFFQSCQRRVPVLFGMLARLLGGVVVLRQRDPRTARVLGQLYRDPVVVVRRVRLAFERTEMAVAEKT